MRIIKKFLENRKADQDRIKIKRHEIEIARILLKAFAQGKGSAERAYTVIHDEKSAFDFDLFLIDPKTLLGNEYILKELQKLHAHAHPEVVQYDRDPDDRILRALIVIFSLNESA